MTARQPTRDGPGSLRSRWGSNRARDSLFGAALVVPALIIFLLLAARPVGEVLLTSFFRRDLTHPELGQPFVGFENYRQLIGLSTFWPTVTNSVVLSLSSAVAQIILGFGAALLLDRAFRLRPLLRASVLLPWAMPTIVAAFVFRWLFDASFGPINAVLDSLGIISQPVAWLGSPETALATVIGVHIWKGLPFVILIFLAALQTLPRDLKDAASVDGAGYWQELRWVTLPQLRYIIAITFILRVIWTFNWFDLTYLLTGGGPGGATMTLPIAVYITAFRTYQLGQSAAYATMIAAVLMVVTVIFLRLTTRADRA
jgi:multiple sugar transport system permease protein